MHGSRVHSLPNCSDAFLLLQVLLGVGNARTTEPGTSLQLFLDYYVRGVRLNQHVLVDKDGEGSHETITNIETGN